MLVGDQACDTAIEDGDLLLAGHLGVLDVDHQRPRQATRRPRATTLSAPDGSWCEVALVSDDGAPELVREGGPTPLWARVEQAWEAWNGWGEQGWERFGITVTPDAHTLWLDQPHNVVNR